MNRRHTSAKLLCLLLSLCLCLVMLGCSAHTAPEKPATDNENTVPADNKNMTPTSDPDSDSFTLLIYMCGSSLESRNGAATDDISELLRAEIPDKVNVIIETGGAMTWKKYDIPNDKIRRYKASGGELTLLDEGELRCMGDASTLQDFIDWGAKTYPAKKTALILWDHGGGFLEGVCRDEIYRNDWLTVAELEDALSNCTLPKPLEFIGFDCCLMSNYETALAVAKYADHMIAAEGDEPVGGWDYEAIAEFLGKENFYGIVLSSFEQAHLSRAEYTLSVTDLRKLDKVTAVLSQCVDKAKNPFRSLSFSQAVAEAKGFDAQVTHLYDLGDIAAYFEVDYDFSDVIIAARSEALRGTCGLSVCCPAEDGEALDVYVQLSGDKKFSSYLKEAYLKN